MIFEDGDRIVFAGDSITDMGSSQPIGEGLFDNLGHGYVRVLDSLLAAVYPEIRLRITNAGTSGNTSRDLLARFQRDVVALKPNWVSICIGINDVWRQFDTPAMFDKQVLPEEYEQNLEMMVSLVANQVKGIFILSPYYIEPNTSDAMRARMDEYTGIAQRVADRHACRFIDFQQAFSDYCRMRHSTFIAWDRVHPNQVGALVMARTFLKACGFDYGHTYES